MARYLLKTTYIFAPVTPQPHPTSYF